jgi:hypothetical protein
MLLLRFRLTRHSGDSGKAVYSARIRLARGDEIGGWPVFDGMIEKIEWQTGDWPRLY